MTTAGVVLDASALIAYLNAEPGVQALESRLSGALLSTVNLSEVIVRLSELGFVAYEIPGDLAQLGIEFIPFTPAHALSAARLRPSTRALGLGLGDRACLALGLERGVAVLTTDRAWAGLGAPHVIEVLR